MTRMGERLRIKALNRGGFNPEGAGAEALAQAARDTLIVRTRLASRPEHLLALGTLYAQLATYEMLREVRDRLTPPAGGNP